MYFSSPRATLRSIESLEEGERPVFFVEFHISEAVFLLKLLVLYDMHEYGACIIFDIYFSHLLHPQQPQKTPQKRTSPIIFKKRIICAHVVIYFHVPVVIQMIYLFNVLQKLVIVTVSFLSLGQQWLQP